MLARAASAAELPAHASLYKAPAAITQSWTGFYVGANVGGSWGQRDVDYAANDLVANSLINPLGGTALPGASFRTSGVVGGLQVGYNWQLNRNWLVGLETDFDWSGIKGSGASRVTVAGVAPVTANVDEHVKWFGTVRARVGILPADDLLAFVSGGFAYGRVEQSGNYTTSFAGILQMLTFGGSSAQCTGPATCYAGSSSTIATGWTLGGGLEYALWRNVTLKAEYLYVDLGSKSVTETAQAVATPGVAPASYNANYSRTYFNVARVGVNYRF
jgi:outer membrane immunogenic protein